MSRHDWYRNTEWDEATEAAFHAKFARTRQPWSRWQYLTIQAGMLSRRFPEAAEQLFEQSLTLKGVEPGWASISHQRLGLLAFRTGKETEAVTRLRASIAACPPDERGIRGTHTPEEQLGRLLWMLDPTAREEAETLLGPLPASLPWPDVPNPPLDACEEPYRSGEDAAEGIVVALHAGDELSEQGVDALFAADPAVLLEMDRLLMVRGLTDLFRPFWDHGRFELPAYLGRCAVRHGGASWVEASTLLDWRLDVGGDRRDPWSIAWPHLQRGTPLAGIYEILAH